MRFQASFQAMTNECNFDLCDIWRVRNYNTKKFPFLQKLFFYFQFYARFPEKNCNQYPEIIPQFYLTGLTTMET